MSYRAYKSGIAVLFILVLAAGWQSTAHAQLGGFSNLLSNLPKDDFTWRWGEQRGSRIEDFSIRGVEAGFECALTGELRLGSRLSQLDIRQLENDLRSSSSFIGSATNAMNVLERQRDLDWAMLDCNKLNSEEEP